MKKIRIGKDIAINWIITTNGQEESLEGADLSIEMRDPKGNRVEITEFDVNYNVINIGLKGTAFRYLGTYTFTLWKNKDKEGQTVVDAVDAFKLVKYTIDEGNDYCKCKG